MCIQKHNWYRCCSTGGEIWTEPCSIVTIEGDPRLCSTREDPVKLYKNRCCGRACHLAAKQRHKLEVQTCFSESLARRGVNASNDAINRFEKDWRRKHADCRPEWSRSAQ